MIKNDIEKAIKEALIATGAGEVNFIVERPQAMEHGDYATNAALAAAKFLKNPPAGGPKELAQSLVEILRASTLLGPDSIKKIESAGAGFINFTLAGTAVKKMVHEAHTDAWGSNVLYKNKRVMVEYTDPNPFKEFHIGHLMSNAIGESIARLFETSGAKVSRANYQGDVGPHVAKAIWGYKKLKEDPNFKEVGYRSKNVFERKEDFELNQWGIAYQLGNAEYERPDSGAKVEIDEINKKVYDRSDPAINALYDQGREESLERFESIYKILGTTFDYYFFESETAPKGWKIVKAHREVFAESEGAIVFKGEEYGLHTRVFITKLGLPTYEAKDLGLLALKAETANVDRSISVTASEQNDYFKVVLEAARHIPELAEFAQKTTHVSHGMMRLTGGKMSSRKGNVITGESLLLELTEAARGRSDVAVGAVKYVVLRSGSGKDIVFDPDKSLSLEGDSGPYVQYALVRARALLHKAAEATSVDPEPKGPSPLERLLIHFPSVVERAASELEPHHVVTYITELASAFNSWYAAERFIVDGKISSRTVAVIKALENTLAIGLKVLGIPAPQEM